MLLPGKDTEERRRHSTAYSPYSHYLCCIPRFFPNVPMHWHSEFELNLVTDGAGEFTCGSETFPAQKGDILLIPPNMLHAAYPTGKGELTYFALVFSPVMLGANLGDRCTAECVRPLMNGALRVTPWLTPELAGYPQLKACADAIFLSVLEGTPLAELRLKSELLRLFWLLEGDESLLHRSQSQEDRGESVRPAMEYMQEHFPDEITIDELAAMTHFSKSYFMTCFKKAVGVSAIEYLAQLRIRAACEALASGEGRVADIAARCGYTNLSNFNRQFKRIAGCSPREYQKTARRGPGTL